MDLGEGRQRYFADDFNLSENPTQILQDQLTRVERENQDAIREKEDAMREKEDAMQENKDLMRENEDLMRRIAELEKCRR